MITREPEYFPPPVNWLGGLGRRVILTCRNVGRSILMLLEAIWCMPRALKKRDRHEIIYQMFLAGIKSLGVLTVVALFTGMILALQVGINLRDFGQEEHIGTAVAVVLMREMGPFMTALIIAASYGSSMAAQLGSMVVSEEIAALELMSINPVRFLVSPRLLALTIIMPILTIYTDIVGVVGGAIVGVTQVDVPMTSYFDNALRFAENKDLYVGLLKSSLFGIIIVTVACHQGFSTTMGAVGVGLATRRTVVISFLTILVVGYIVTRMFYQ